MRSYLCCAASLLLVGVMGSVVAAQPIMMVAEQDQLEENGFTLEFFDVIEGQEVIYYETTSEILQTDYDLRIETPAPETARFTNYFQDVEPLLLPDPTGKSAGLSTGNLSIRVVP